MFNAHVCGFILDFHVYWWIPFVCGRHEGTVVLLIISTYKKLITIDIKCYIERKFIVSYKKMYELFDWLSNEIRSIA